MISANDLRRNMGQCANVNVCRAFEHIIEKHAYKGEVKCDISFDDITYENSANEKEISRIFNEIPECMAMYLRGAGYHTSYSTTPDGNTVFHIDWSWEF